MPEGLFDQWSTIEPLFRGMPTWLSGDDQRRLAAYDTYEEIYWNVPEAFRLLQRGDDAKPIYVASGRQIVETLHRFLAPGLSIVSDSNFGTPEQRSTGEQFINDLFRRERFRSSFSANKRFGIIRGDWIFHVYADEERDPGSRIPLETVDPSSYFPLYNPYNVDEIIGCHLVDQYTTDNGDQLIRRLTYRKETERGGPSPILMSDQLFEVDAWGQPGTEMEEETAGDANHEAKVDVRLPDLIDAIPVYHIRNFVEPNNPFGSSELRGLEVMINAVNQAVSDEDLTLAMDGVGVYTTNAAPPEDEEGNELPWRLGPAQVVELVGPGSGEDRVFFERVSGASSVTPYQDHIRYLHDQLDLGSGTPAVAKGQVEVSTAESGIALNLKMGPILARAVEKEDEIVDVMANMLYDIRKFARVFESEVGNAMEAIRLLPSFAEKLPIDRKQRFTEITDLGNMNPPIVTRKWIRQELAKIGFEFPEDTEFQNEIVEDIQLFGQLEADSEGARIDSEIGDV